MEAKTVFVVAELDEKQRPVAYFTRNTQLTVLLEEDLQLAIAFDSKADARLVAGGYQSSNADKDISILTANLKLELA